MKLIKELNESNAQRELDFDGKNALDIKASKLHDAFDKPPFSSYFYRKPSTWDEALSKKKAIKMEDLFGVLPPEDIQDLEFTEREVYGSSFNRPLKSFSPLFKKKNLDAFFVITAEGVFAVRTEGADYARYVAQVEEYDGSDERRDEK